MYLANINILYVDIIRDIIIDILWTLWPALILD